MPSPSELLLHRLAVADPATAAQLVHELRNSDDSSVLVAVALFADEPSALLQRAKALATSSRDRQCVAIAAAYVDGDRDRVELLARDHLVDHPENVLVAWIAAAAQHLTPTRKEQS